MSTERRRIERIAEPVPVDALRAIAATDLARSKDERAYRNELVLALLDRLEEAERAGLTWKRRAEDAEEVVGRVVALADGWMARDGDLTASEADGGPEGHRDDDNAGERRVAREEGL